MGENHSLYTLRFGESEDGERGRGELLGHSGTVSAPSPTAVLGHHYNTTTMGPYPKCTRPPLAHRTISRRTTFSFPRPGQQKHPTFLSLAQKALMVKGCASIYFTKKICGLMTFMPMSFERVGASTDIDSHFARCLRGYNFRGPGDTGRMKRHFQVLYSTKVRSTKSRSKVPSFPRLLYVYASTAACERGA